MVYLVIFGVIVIGAFAVIAFTEVKDWISENKPKTAKTNPNGAIS